MSTRTDRTASRSTSLLAALSVLLLACSSSQPTGDLGMGIVAEVLRLHTVEELVESSPLIVRGEIVGEPVVQADGPPPIMADFDYPFEVSEAILGMSESDTVTVSWTAPLQPEQHALHMDFDPLGWVEPRPSPGEYVLFLWPAKEPEGVFRVSQQNFGGVWRVLADGSVEAPPASEPYFAGMTVEELAEAVREASEVRSE